MSRSGRMPQAARPCRSPTRSRLGVYRVDPIGVRVQIAEFRFDSASTDTRRVGLGLVTCRASHALERALLDQVAARV